MKNTRQEAGMENRRYSGIFFVRLNTSGGILLEENVIHHPPQHRMPTVSLPFFQRYPRAIRWKLS